MHTYIHRFHATCQEAYLVFIPGEMSFRRRTCWKWVYLIIFEIGIGSICLKIYFLRSVGCDTLVRRIAKWTSAFRGSCQFRLQCLRMSEAWLRSLTLFLDVSLSLRRQIAQQYKWWRRGLCIWVYPYQAVKLLRYFHAAIPDCENNRRAVFSIKGTVSLSRTRHRIRSRRPINLTMLSRNRSRHGGYSRFFWYKQTAE